MQDKLTNEQKVSTLHLALQERYESMRVIRERVQNICIWVLGILLSASGWIIQNDTIFYTQKKLLFFTGILISLIVLRFWYLNNLEKGFKAQQKVAVRIEKSLGLFELNIFDESGEPIYLKSWEKAGLESSDGQFFKTNYMLLYVGFVFLSISIFLSGCVF